MTTDARLLSARRGAALRPFLDDTLSALDVRGDGRSSTTWVPRHTAGVVVGDVVALGIALLAALIVSLRLTGGWEPSTPWVLGGVATLWLAALAGSGGYNRYHCGTGSEEYRAIGRAAVVTLAVVSAAALIADSRDARTVLLYIAGMDWFDALNHSFSTVATGGFSTKNNSIAAYPQASIQWILIFFMFIAGINFSLHAQALRGVVKVYLRDRECRFYTVLLILGSAVIVAGLVEHGLFGMRSFPEFVPVTRRRSSSTRYSCA